MLLIRHQKVWITGFIVVLCTLFLVNVGLFYQFYEKTQRQTFTGCLKHVAQKHIFILDKSSVVSSQTQSEIFARIQQQVSTIKNEEYAAFYVITSQSLTELKPVFQACKTDNKFSATLLQSAKNSIYTQTDYTKVTPLAEALLDIDLSHQQIEAERTKMFIYSDLLQNSQHVTVSENKSLEDTIAQFKATRSGGVQRPTFINTFVYLHIIPRAQLPEALVKSRNGFWLWFFGDMRGKRQYYGLERHDLPGSYTQ